MIAKLSLILATVAAAASGGAERWPGVDEAVVEKIAVEAGQKPWSVPFAPEGDALLFAFLVAGLAGGFVLGYQYRALFSAPTKAREERRS